MDVFTLAAKLVLDTGSFSTDLAAAEAQTKGFGSIAKTALKGIGTVAAGALTTTAVAAGKFFKDAMNAGLDFDSMMSQVQAVSGATGTEFDMLRQRAIELGATTKFTASEAAGAYYYMGMAGWDAEQMLEGIDGILNLAAASGEDLATTSDIVTDALTAFGLEAEDAAHFSNVLAATATSANTNVAMMGETFKYVAPVAGSLGIQAEDMAESIGLMANQGIKASQAGTALRSMLLRISTDAGATSKSLGALGIIEDELGVSFYEYGENKEALQAYNDYVQSTLGILDEEGNAIEGATQKEIEAVRKMRAELADEILEGTEIRDWNEFLADVREAWAGLSVEKQSEYGKKIAGTYGSSGWLALMNTTESDIEKLRGAIDAADEGTGAAQNMAETMLNNLQGDLTILNSAIDGLKLTVSDEFKESFRGFVQTITQGITDITESIRENGLAKGLWAWLIGENELDLIGDRLENDMNDAETNAATATALTGYLQELVTQYGEAATKTGEWKKAVEDLEAVMPGVGDQLSAQGTTLQENLEKVIAMKDEMRQMAIEQAMGKALESEYEYLGEQTKKRTEAEYAQSMYSSMVGSMDDRMLRMINMYSQAYIDQVRENNPYVNEQDLAGMQQWATLTADQAKSLGYSSEQLIEFAKQALYELQDAYAAGDVDQSEYLWNKDMGDDLLGPEQLQALDGQLDEWTKKLEQANQDIAEADAEIKRTEEQITITQGAMQRTAAAMSGTSESVEIGGDALASSIHNAANKINAAHGDVNYIPHAKGAWDIPYDEYPALLHRGEMVLTASQARRYRNGQNGGGIDMRALSAAVSAAVRAGFAGVNFNLDGQRVAQNTTERQAADEMAWRFAV